MRDSVSNFFGGTDEQIYAEAAGDALPNLYGLATSLRFRDRHDHAQIDIRVFRGGAVSIGTEKRIIFRGANSRAMSSQVA